MSCIYSFFAQLLEHYYDITMATRFWVLDQMTYIVLIFSHPSTICTLVVEKKLKAWTHTRWFEKGGFYLLWHTLYNVMCVHNKKRRMEGALGMCKSTLVKFFLDNSFFIKTLLNHSFFLLVVFYQVSKMTLIIIWSKKIL